MQAELGHVAISLREYNKQVHFGAITTMGKEDKLRHVRRIALVSDADAAVLAIPEIDNHRLDWLKATGRLQEKRLMAEDGTGSCIVANFYGLPGASSCAATHKQNETMLLAAVLRSQDFKEEPYYLFGDFNISIEGSAVLTKSIQGGIIFDLASEWAPAGQGPTPTFRREGVSQGMQGSGTTRIDFAMANYVGSHIVDAVNFLWDESSGFDHVAIQVDIDLKGTKQEIYKLKKPPKIDVELIKQSNYPKDYVVEVYERVWGHFEDKFQTAIDKEELQAAHNIWCEAMELFLNELQPTR